MIKRQPRGLEIREMDELADMHSPIHGLHPLMKLIVTAAYILVTTSFHKYQISGLIVMVLYPVILSAVSKIPMKTCFYKMRFVLPIVCAVGIVNPFFDREILLDMGEIAVSGGVVSMMTLLLKGAFCLMASFYLVATTSIDALCAALRKLHMPQMLVTLILLTYRYIAVMMEEVSVMVTAYQLRAPGQRGIHHRAWGSFLGQLLLRSMDKAEEIYFSMQLRGFHGDFWYAESRRIRAADIVFCAGTIFLFLIFRRFDVAQMAGSLLI